MMRHLQIYKSICLTSKFTNFTIITFFRDREIEELKIAVSEYESQHNQDKIRTAQTETFYHDKLVELKEQLEVN
jgi:alpha/beta superfamily hydrolase